MSNSTAKVVMIGLTVRYCSSDMSNRTDTAVLIYQTVQIQSERSNSTATVVLICLTVQI
jgi:hypothetical protein